MQSRRQSFIESVVHALAGYGASVATTHIVFPVFGIPLPAWDGVLLLSLCYFAVSLAVKYPVRRGFEWWGR